MWAFRGRRPTCDRLGSTYSGAVRALCGTGVIARAGTPARPCEGEDGTPAARDPPAFRPACEAGRGGQPPGRLTSGVSRQKLCNKVLNDNVCSVIVCINVMKSLDDGGLKARLKRHLRDVLSIGVALEAWPGEGSLPAFLRERYAFMTARVLGVPALFLADKDVRRTTPAAIRKHIFEVQKRWDGEVIYVADGIDSARRKQLIDQKVPFVVPGNQIFLPMLGVDLREHFRSVRRAAERLSPAAQAVFLRLLQARTRALSLPWKPQRPWDTAA